MSKDRSAISRAAAHARWAAPRSKTARIYATIPAELAERLLAAAEREGRPTSEIVAEALAERIGEPCGTPAPAPFDITADAATVDPRTSAPTIVRIHYRAATGGEEEAKEDYTANADSPRAKALVAFLKGARDAILGQIIPALTLAERTQATLRFQGQPVAVIAERGRRG